MTTLAVDPIFLDTNILVYANVVSAPLHTTALNQLQQLWDDGHPLWVSRQVLREYLAVLTRPQTFSQPQPVAIVAERIRFFTTHFQVADENATVTENLLALLTNLEVKGKQIHDANIVATMQAYGITHLLTNNVADFQRFAHLITIVPL
jgi:predicted nucleic acid-binding protein